MRRFIIFVLLVTHADVLLPQSSIIWPTDASYFLTSTFGEYRPDHFHSGIDIKTWGREGYRVFAVDNGYVERVKVSPYGYGKVLYLKLDNGMTAVFAHLSRFFDQIVPFVVETQENKKRYSVLVRFPKNLLKVKKGDVIGFTGSTGIGYPHLHFELRDSLNQPLNPLFCLGSYVKDIKPPKIVNVAAMPLNGNTRIKGDILPVIYKVEEKQESKYEISEPIIAKGCIGLAVSVFDKAGGVQNRYSAFSLKLNVDGENVFSEDYDTLSFRMAPFVDLDRNYMLRKSNHGLFNNLFCTVEKICPLYLSLNRGVLFCDYHDEPARPDNGTILKYGRHIFKIIAEDFKGNSSEVTGVILAGRDYNFPHNSQFCNSILTPHRSITPNLKLEHEFYQNNIRFRLTSTNPLDNVPVLDAMVNSWDFRSIRLFKKSPVEYFGILPLYDIKDSYLSCTAAAVFNGKDYTVSDSADIFFISHDRGGSIISEDGVCQALFGRGSFYNSCAVSIEIIGSSLYGKHYRILPEHLLLASRIVVQFFLPRNYSEDSKAAIYRIDGIEKSFVGNEYKNGLLYGYARSLGTFTVLKDTTPPNIFKIVPEDKSVILSSYPVISVKFKDDLSGIQGEDSYLIFIDNKKYIAEYDPEKDIAKALILSPLKQGSHKLYIRISDRSGNVSEATRTFFIR